jgi:hypothetical protein
MQTPLSPEEKDIVFQLLNLQHDAELQSELAAFAAGTFQPLSQEARQALGNDAHLLARNGLHQLALEAVGPILAMQTDLHLAVAMAKSAVLNDDFAAARSWADRAYSQLIAPSSEDSSPVFHYGMDRMLQALQLYKVGQMLGHAELQASLPAIVKGLVRPQRQPGHILLDCLRLTVELGFKEEAIQVLLHVPVISIGMSDGIILERCFRTLLGKDHPHFVWAILGMTYDMRNLVYFHIVAIDISFEMGRHDWAIQFAARTIEGEEFSGLAYLAKSLLSQGKLSEWKPLWDNIYRQDFPHLTFDTQQCLTFLVNLVAHCSSEDRLIMLHVAQEEYHAAASIGNKDYAAEISALCLVIYAWAGEEAAVRAMLLAIDPPKAFWPTLLNAALHRGFEFLVEAICPKCYPDLTTNPISQLTLEYLRMEAGRDHQLEPLLENIKSMALAARNIRLLSGIARLMRLQWKDRNRSLQLEIELFQKFGCEGRSMYFFLQDLAEKGDLELLQTWLTNDLIIEEMRSEYFTFIETCLDRRCGLNSRLADF